MQHVNLNALFCIGAPGFEAVWTEYHHPVTTECEEHEILCERNLLCIDKDLVCNGEYNCGEKDNTDESEEKGCVVPTESTIFQEDNMMFIIIGASALGGTVLLIAICIFVCRRRRTQRRNRKRRDPIQNQTEWNN